MEAKLEQILNTIEPIMNEKEVLVDSIVWEKENGYNYLKITLDKTNGIDLDAVVEATNIINPIIDELDLIQDEYILDISSKERGIENE